MKYFEISVSTANSRYLQTAALKKGKCHDSLRGWRLKGKGKGVLGARETRGARKGAGRETPPRKPLFSPSRLLNMYAKITQL